MTLVDVLEEIHTHDDLSKGNGLGLIHIDLAFVVTFESSSPEESSVVHDGLFWLLTADGEKSNPKPFKINFDGLKKCRMTANIENIQFGGYGTYSLNVGVGESTAFWSFDVVAPASAGA